MFLMDYLRFTHTLHPCKVLFCSADISEHFFCSLSTLCMTLDCLRVFQPSLPALTLCLYNDYASVLPMTLSLPVIDLCLPLRLFILPHLKLRMDPHSVDPSLKLQSSLCMYVQVVLKRVTAQPLGF